MGTDDLQKLMAEIRENQREMRHHVVRMMERQSDHEASMEEMKATQKELHGTAQELRNLTSQITDSNIRLSRILEVHDYSTDELDARLKRLEERRRNGGIQ